MSPVESQARATRTAVVLAVLLVATLALEAWGIGSFVSGLLR